MDRNQNHQSYQILQYKVDELSNKLNELGILVTEVAKVCNTHKLVTTEQIDRLECLLAEYRNQAEPVLEYCSDNGLAFDSSIKDVGDSLLEKLRLISDAKFIEEVSAFSGLRCELEVLSDELTEAKRELNEVLGNIDSGSPEEKILPFWAVVQNVRGEEVSEEACTAMEDRFSKSFYRAVYKRQFSFDGTNESAIAKIEEKCETDCVFSKDTTNLVRDEHIQTCESKQRISQTEELVVLPNGADIVNDGEIAVNCGNGELSNGAACLFEEYCGYVEECTLLIESTADGNQFQAKKFIGDVVRVPGGGNNLFIMALIGHKKAVFLNENTLIDETATINYLFKKGYLSKLTLAADSKTYEGYCLSESGVESFEKESTKTEYKKKGYATEKILPVAPSALSAIACLRFDAITRADNYWDFPIDLFKCFWSNAQTKEFAEGLLPIDDQQFCSIYSSLVQPGREKEYFELIKERITSEAKVKTVIIVNDINDIATISSLMKLDKESYSRTYYYCPNAGADWYNGASQTVEPIYEELDPVGLLEEFERADALETLESSHLEKISVDQDLEGYQPTKEVTSENIQTNMSFFQGDVGATSLVATSLVRMTVSGSIPLFWLG